MVDLSKITEKIMSFYYPKTIATLLAIGTPTIYFISLHHRLSRKIHHTTRTGPLTSLPASNIKSIPASALTNPTHALYDNASLPISTSRLPQDLNDQQLFIKYLRRNMTMFSRFPQALALRLTSTDSNRHTFSTSHIRQSNFDVGDVICGLYTVTHRSETKVELSMKQGVIEGVLAIYLERRGGEMVFESETVMWKPASEKRPLPLEVGAIKWLHELAAWGLISSGVRSLTS